MNIKCIKCLEVKDEEEFGRAKTKLNGRKSSCKVCTAAYQKAHNAIPEVKERNAAQEKAQRAIPEVRERNATRQKEYRAIPEVKEKIKEWWQSEAGKASHKKADDKRLATPEGQQKNKARRAVRTAVEAGRMVKPERCSLFFPLYPICKGQIEGHHHLGYDREHWLDVQWLCAEHHIMLDRTAA